MSTLHAFIRRFTSASIVDDKSILKLKNSYYLCPEQLRQMVLRASSDNKVPLFAGTLLGKEYTTKKGAETFVPSTRLLSLLARAAEHTVTVNDKGAWLFICGRDLWGESITSSKGNPKAGELTLVLNKHREPLGIGRVEQKLTARGLVITNLFDIGWFARKKCRGIPVG